MNIKYFLTAAIIATLATGAHAATTIDEGGVSTFTVQKAAKSVPIETAATDDSGAAGITQKIYIAGVLKATAYGGTLVYKWNVSGIKPGVYDIKITAEDQAGNMRIIHATATRL